MNNGGNDKHGNSGVYVYEIRKPGSDFDGTPTWFSAFEGREAADKKVLARAEMLGAELVYVGRGFDMDSDRSRRFEPAYGLDVATLPWWAREWIAEQELRGMPKLSKREREVVESLVRDSGHTQASALAWIKEFGVDEQRPPVRATHVVPCVFAERLRGAS